MINDSTKLKRGTVYAYAAGEFGFNFFLLFVGYHLMFYLTDVIKLPIGVAAVLYTLVQWFEAITVVISGALIDKSRFKGGKYRPWMLFGGAACMLGTFLFFTRWNFSISAWMIAFPLFYLIAYWGYNFMWVSYRALNGIIGKSSEQTVDLTITGSQAGTIASLIFSTIGAKILYSFTDIKYGFSFSAALYGILMLVCIFIVYKAAAAYDKPEAEVFQGEKRKYKLSEILCAFKGPMFFYFTSTTLRSAVASAVPALMVYYFNYVVNMPNLLSVYMSVITAAQFVGVFLVKHAANSMGKKKLYIISAFMQGVCLFTGYALARTPAAFIAIMAANQFFSTFGGTLMPAFMNDIELYNEYAYGMEMRAFSYSIGATAIRLASIIGGAVASFGLAAIGYEAGATIQNPAVCEGIIILMSVTAGIIMFLSIVPMLFYNLDEKTMINVYESKAVN